MLLALLVAFSALTLVWVISLSLRDVSIIDVFWGIGFVLIGIAAIWRHGGLDPRSKLIFAIVAVWALRLALHLFLRWRRLGHEDRRYSAMRRKAGPRFPVTSLFTVFWLQAGVMWVVSLPLQQAFAAAPTPLGPLDLIGAAIALLGILVEAVADYQLTRFGRDPANRGRVLETGLWAWSRHPNYFGDTVVWWGVFVLCLVASHAWWTVIGPVVMTYFLMRVSGVPMLERKMADRRPEYADYIRRTSTFVPWPPKS
jgi:steroid 5-alpha reductase family enzyme